MKIIFVTRYSGNLNTLWMENNFIDELSRSDIKITIFKIYDSGSNIQLLDDSMMGSDMLISDLLDDYLTEELIGRFELYKNPKLLIAFDNLSIPFQHRKSSKIYDLMWLTSKETEELIKGYGANTIFMPYAANPYIPFEARASRIPGVSFVGSVYGARKSQLASIAKSGFNVNLYTNNIHTQESLPLKNFLSNKQIFRAYEYTKFSIGRKCLLAALIKSFKNGNENLDDIENIKQCPPLDYFEIPGIYRNSDFCLNVSELWNTYVLKNPVHKLHLRTFEIPMFGGAQLCKNNPEIREYFENGKEILLYENQAEMVGILEKYSRSDMANSIEEIKTNARKRSCAEHTWLKRFKKIFNVLGL